MKLNEEMVMNISCDLSLCPRNGQIPLSLAPVLKFMSLVFSVAVLALVIGCPMASAQDVISIGKDVVVRLDKAVDGNVVVIGGNIVVSGVVNGDAVAFGGNVRLRSTADVKGDVIAVGGRIEQGIGARVRGQVVEGWGASRSMLRSMISLKQSAIAGFAVRLIILLCWLILAILVLQIVPGQTAYVARYLEKDIFTASLAGILGAVCVPVIIVLLAVTLIGIPLIPIFVMVVGAAFIFGYVCTGFWLGQRLRQLLESIDLSDTAQILMGITAVSVLSWIPFAGGLIMLLAFLSGFGAVLATKFGTGSPWFSGRSVKPAGVGEVILPPEQDSNGDRETL